ncbi:serine hydrolase domain-containing protein [Pedobacter lusitanus]|uniref:serine hydrolase domain-containing protein n=1 Tax=Pedobacter lusitanus TaxID=1503925 RepID=UPI000696B3F3|nr:serine hydrolase domain-containing protein [Pedobacter lusitanus]
MNFDISLYLNKKNIFMNRRLILLLVFGLFYFKTFTAVLIFKAIEEKKLSLTQPIDKYFPAIKNSNKITVADLLSHRSRIHNFTNDEEYSKWSTTKKSGEELLTIITKGGSDFEPGSRAAYSSSNFVLLSFILQKIYNKEYAELLKGRILDPSDLKKHLYW